MVTRFGAYEILYELKTGGMGAVLLGRRRGPGTFEQLVAIKTIRAEYAQTAAVRAMFLDEAAILARLSHPAIATVHDFGEQDGTLYMVMEYVAGIALRDIEQAMPPAVAARAIAEACRGVHAAHELHDLAGHLLGVVHRDISPDNLMIGFDGHVKVIDFGIALVKNRQAPVTEFGTIKGKPPYMSPEQVKNEALDRRSDVFSLAVVLWELLTGRELFDGDSIYAIARAVEHQPIVPPSHARGEPLPLGLDATVMNALDRDLARRTPSAAALAEQLEQVIQTAGDETLEAWAERVLAGPRTAHRAWLASVVAGRDAPRPIGRPTGSITAVAAAPAAAPGAPPTVVLAAPAALPPSEPSPDPAVSTHLAAASGDELTPPRRRPALPVVLGLIALLVVGGGVYLRGHAGEPPVVADAAVATPDARVDAQVVVDRDAPGDAPGDSIVEPPPPPPDAGHHRTVRGPLDAGRRVEHDAAGPPPAVPVAAPRGTGKLTAKTKGETYLNVVLDGAILGPTPMFGKPIAAGAHVIQLVDPRTSKVVVQRTVTLGDGDQVTIVEP